MNPKNQSNQNNDGVSLKEARQLLGEQGYFAFSRWLREKGYDNLEQLGENKYGYRYFATRSQIVEFIQESLGEFRGTHSTVHLLGQTRELLSKRTLRGKKK